MKNDTRNWQVSIDNPSEIVDGIADITQCIHIILTTVPGSDPLRPGFGSNVYKYLDKPLETMRPQIIHAAIEAINRWEKRIEISACSVTKHGDRTQITIEGMIVGAARQTTIKAVL